ncbi:hypothetical protein Tco_1264909 [Tanacetum coccineum]
MICPFPSSRFEQFLFEGLSDFILGFENLRWIGEPNIQLFDEEYVEGSLVISETEHFVEMSNSYQLQIWQGLLKSLTYR